MTFTARQVLTAAQLNDLDINTLTTSGDVTVGGTLTATISAAGSDGQIQYNNGGAFGGASGLYYQDSTGNVGIGTTSPAAALSFANSTGNKIDLFHDTAGSGDRYGIQVQSSELRIHSGAGGSGTGGITLGKSNTATFTEHMRITNDGNVGIGRTDPNTLLHVNGAVTISNDAGTGNTHLPFTDGRFYYTADPQAAGTGDHVFRHYSSGSYQEQMRILENGNVGIGTTSPDYLLELQATTPILNVKGADSSYAEIRAVGTNQGTGASYVGQSSTYGGGMFYNGDGSPAYATGESSDRISFFRRGAGTNEVVFSYPYNSNDVTFRGNTNHNTVNASLFSYSTTGRYIQIGPWSSDGNWAAVQGANGYLLLDGNYSDSNIYLRPFGNSVTYLGYNNRLSVTNTAVNVDASASLYFGSTVRQMVNLWSTNYGIGVQSNTQYFRTGSRFSWYAGGSHNNSENNAGGGSNMMTLQGSNLTLYSGQFGTSKNSTGNVGNASLNLGLGNGSGVIAAWNPNNYAPLITVGQGEHFYVRNYLNSAYAVWDAVLINRSSVHDKHSIMTLGEMPRSAGAASNPLEAFDAMETVRQLRPVSYFWHEQNALPRMPCHEDGTANTRRIQALTRLNKIRKAKGLDEFTADYLKHLCGRDCEHTPDDPCFRVKNYRNGKIGFIAQEVGALVPAAAHLSEERDEPESLDAVALTAILTKAIQQIDARLTSLEAT